jgi:GNAT superfamily N-acetyltransferase
MTLDRGRLRPPSNPNTCSIPLRHAAELGCAVVPTLGSVARVPDLVIRPLDPRDDADMDAFQDVYAAAELAEDPTAALYSREDGVALLSSTEGSSLFDAFGAFHDGRMVAEGILMGSNRDNLSFARILLWVDPDRQRQGYGSRLLSHVEQHARTRGRTVLHAQARIGAGLEHNRRFAEQHGYALDLTEIERRLSFPLDQDLVDRLAAEAAPHHGAYEIVGVVGPVPGPLRQSYVDVQNLLAMEMPHGEFEFEQGQDTVADLDASDREHAQAGRTSVTGLALHDGRVVAYAHASVPGPEFDHVDQYGTLVHPAHRGHRLGMAVKCAQLRLISEHFPERRHVRTTNAETNAHMVAINEALGFAVHQVWGEFEKRLT